MFPNLINQEINIFKQMAIQNLPICSFNEVRANEVRGEADVSWSNLCPWIAQLLRVNIAPSPTSLSLFNATIYCRWPSTPPNFFSIKINVAAFVQLLGRAPVIQYRQKQREQ